MFVVVRMCVCMYECMFLCLRACVPEYVCVSRTRTRTRARTRTRICTRTRARTPTPTRTYARTRTSTPARTCARTRTSTPTPTCTHTHIRRRTHTHTHIPNGIAGLFGLVSSCLCICSVVAKARPAPQKVCRRRCIARHGRRASALDLCQRCNRQLDLRRRRVWVGPFLTVTERPKRGQLLSQRWWSLPLIRVLFFPLLVRHCVWPISEFQCVSPLMPGPTSTSFFTSSPLSPAPKTFRIEETSSHQERGKPRFKVQLHLTVLRPPAI